jgi:tight adherence protein C
VEPLTIGILVFATIFAGTLALFRRAPATEAVAARLEQIEQTQLPRAMTLGMPFYRRALMPFAKSAANLVIRFMPPRSIEAVRDNLIKAGRREADPVAWILSKWVRTAVLGGLAYVTGRFAQIPTAQSLLMAFPMAGIGYISSEFGIRSAITKRQNQILRELPETLDLLTISVEAGLGLDQALEVVTRRRTGPLSDEIRIYLEEVKLGRDRNEALKAIGKRGGLDELISFTSALVQAMEFGVSIAQVLRIQADEVRVRRRQRIEERAMKAPVKMLFPIIFLILPSIFVVAAGPGLIRVYTEFIRPSGPSQFAPPSR